MTGVYAVFDVVAKTMIGPLIVVPNDAAARRLFQDALTSQGSTLASHPEDYVLFRVGQLDVETGRITQGVIVPFADEPVVSGDFIVEQLRRRSSNSALPEAVAQASTDGDVFTPDIEKAGVNYGS